MGRTKSNLNICPKCGTDIVAVEYSYDNPYHYDGTSEWCCLKAITSDGKECDYKLGRFCGQRLSWHQSEMPNCMGVHPAHEHVKN